MTGENLPSWCQAIDQIVEKVAKKKGIGAEEAKKALTGGDEKL